MGASIDWFNVRVVLVALGVWGVAGCGNSASDSNARSGSGGFGASAAGTTTERAGADGGGAFGGVAGAGGTLAAGSSAGGNGGSVIVLSGDSSTEACMAYVVAQCLRRTECLGHPATVTACLAATSGCPDTLFSDGSTRTIASTQACAAQYATYSCEKLNAGFLPDCATPGTRAAGQACTFNAQCASISCDVRTADCGQCSSLGELGASCSTLGLDCKPGLDCDRNMGQCVTHVDRLAEGSPCVGVSACRDDLFCTKGVCAKIPTLGTSCADTGECTKDSYCSMGARICAALPGTGKPCGTDAGGGSRCSGEAYCSSAEPTLGMCLAFPTSGQTCGPALSADMTIVLAACAEGLFCNASTLCVPPGPAGASCQGDGQCQAGLSCACNDATCSARSCVTVGLKDQPCGVLGATCHPGFSCVASHCQPRASQGLFAAKCTGN